MNRSRSPLDKFKLYYEEHIHDKRKAKIKIKLDAVKHILERHNNIKFNNFLFTNNRQLQPTDKSTLRHLKNKVKK